jgi:ankyrin repeat protein
MSSIRIERNHDSLSAGPARAVVRCLEDTLSGCMEDPYSSNAFSCIFFQLGVCYAVGFGVNQNMLEAKRYFNNAAESGSIDAQAIIERFEEQTDRRLIDLNKPSRWSHNGAMAGSWIAAKCVAEFPKTLLAIYEHLAKEDSHMTSEAWTSLPGLETLLDELKDSNSGINDKTFTSRKDKVMHIATLKNDLPALKLLTQNPDIDINATNSKGETPLICAMRAGNRRCATFLIDQGASVTAEDERGITAVHWIINCLDTSDDVARLIEKFQQRGANLHARSRCALIYSDLYGAILFPGTPLDWAVDTGNFVALRILAERYILVAENGADPFDLTFRNGRPPAIHRMASNHQHELLTAFKRCIEFKALLQQLDTEGKSALWYALQPGNSFNRLMYDTPNTQGQSQTLKHLIEGGADVRYVNSSGETALYSAVKAGSLPCVEFLLARQEVQQMLCSRSSPQEFSPLRRSIYAENTGIFYSIFQHLDISDIGEWGYEVSPDGLNLLHECCLGPEQVSVSIAESLLTEQCESNREELLGQRCCGCDLTPFQLAVLCNKLELAEIFIHHGANPLEGHHDQRFLGYLLEYQTFTEEHVTTLLQTIIDDEAVRSVRRLPHPGQILPAVQYLVRSDKKWFDTSNKNLEHAPKFISSTSIDKLGSFLVSAREDPKQSVEYGSRWVTALDLALDCVSRSAFRKPAESVFATVLSHWNKSKYVNFPDVQVLHNTSMRIRNLRRRETLLHRAIRLGSPEIVESLLNSEADWEMANHEWMSPLHLAKNIAFPHHLQGLFVERYATSFWGRLAQPQHQVSIAREMKAELIVDILQQRKTPWTDILLIRALREVWWPWDDYEIDNFGYKHLILWLFVVSVVVGILAILFIASAERPSVAPIVDLYHNITQAWEDVGTEFFSTITSCFDDCYRKGCDPATVCGLAWLNRIHAGNARLISISDWVVGRELDCYDLAKARNQSYDDCRGTLSPTYFWGEFQKGALPFSIYNMTNELCTVEFELRAPNKTGDGS